MKRSLNSEDVSTRQPVTEHTRRTAPLQLLTDIPRGMLRDEILPRLADSPLARRCLASTSTALNALVQACPGKEGAQQRTSSLLKELVQTSPGKDRAMVQASPRKDGAQQPRALHRSKICTQAAREGNLGVLQQARRSGRPWSPETAEAAAAGGHLYVLAWLCENECPCNMINLAQRAAEGGHLPVLVWLEGRGCSFDKRVLQRAADWGHWSVLEWLQRRFKMDVRHPPLCGLVRGPYNPEMLKSLWRCGWGFDDRALLTFAVKGDLATLKWITARFDYRRGRAVACLALAAGRGHLHVVEWLVARGCPKSTSACTGAAQRGQLTTLQWLRRHNFPWNSNVCTAAAEEGHVEIVKWARKMGCPWSRRTTSSAARRGNLPMLKWLWRENAPLDSLSVRYAALCGHVKVLQWLLEQGVPYDSEAAPLASLFGRLDAVQYLYQRGLATTENVAYSAAQHGHTHILEGLCKKGAHLHSNLWLLAASKGHLHILRLLHQHQTTFPQQAWFRAAKHGNLEVMKVLQLMGYSLPRNLIKAAVRACDCETVRWLIDQGCPMDERANLHSQAWCPDVEICRLLENYRVDRKRKGIFMQLHHNSDTDCSDIAKGQQTLSSYFGKL